MDFDESYRREICDTQLSFTIGKDCCWSDEPQNSLIAWLSVDDLARNFWRIESWFQLCLTKRTSYTKALGFLEAFDFLLVGVLKCKQPNSIIYRDPWMVNYRRFRTASVLVESPYQAARQHGTPPERSPWLREPAYSIEGMFQESHWETDWLNLVDIVGVNELARLHWN